VFVILLRCRYSILVLIDMEMKSAEEKLVEILKKNGDGLTITELVSKADFSRSTVRVALAKLEGGGQVLYKNIGMAKVYVLGGVK